MSDSEDRDEDADDERAEDDAEPDEAPPLFVVRGEAGPEEIAALAVVLAGLAARAAAAASARRRPPLWSAPHRRVRTALQPGPGAWRASGLPR